MTDNKACAVLEEIQEDASSLWGIMQYYGTTPLPNNDMAKLTRIAKTLKDLRNEYDRM